ncbi:MAG: hypothetical protein F6K52_11130 [Moorea sp. SIO3H5]|nr:hypothetical protein [Moorena sp. SIO3H5]
MIQAAISMHASCLLPLASCLLPLAFCMQASCLLPFVCKPLAFFLRVFPR